MIHLDKGQILTDHPEFVVYDETGDYNDTDMVRCAKAENPFEPFCWYEAQYILYGGMVYSISDDAQLATEITKIDPDTTIMEVASDSPAVSPKTSATPTTETTQQTSPAPQATTSQEAPVSSTIDTTPVSSEPSSVVSDPTPVSGGETPVVEPAIIPDTSTATVVPATDVIEVNPESPVSVIMRKRRRKLKLS